MYKVVLIYTRPSLDVPFFGTSEMSAKYPEFHMAEEANKQAVDLMMTAKDCSSFETMTSGDGLTFTQVSYWTSKEAFEAFEGKFHSLFQFRWELRESYCAITGCTSRRADEDNVEMPEK